MKYLMLALTATLSPPVPQERPPIGMAKDKMFPDFLLPNVEGGSGRLSDYRGKKVLLFNFASW